MAREIQWDDEWVQIETQSKDVLDGDAVWTSLGPRTWSVLLHGVRFKVEMERLPDANGRALMRINGARKEVRVLDERTKLLEKMGMSVSTDQTSSDVKAPMPGKVLQVLVNEGDEVQEGQPLLVLEAMKMENIIKAVAEAEVKTVPITEGQAVEKGALLVGF